MRLIELGIDGCCQGPHVYRISSAVEKQKLYQFRRLVDFDGNSRDKIEPIIALDGEMAYTTCGMELLRISAVNMQLEKLFDVYVEPFGVILDYNSRWSGITSDSFTSLSKLSLSAAQDLLFACMSPQTILVGHSLDSDLVSLVSVAPWLLLRAFFIF